MRAAAVGALFRLGEPAAVEGIRRLAQDPTWHVRSLARDALEALGKGMRTREDAEGGTQRR